MVKIQSPFRLDCLAVGLIGFQHTDKLDAVKTRCRSDKLTASFNLSGIETHEPHQPIHRV